MQFEITFDYLCPFARNANEAVLAGLRAGRDWDVGFRPFSLSQAHVNEGDATVFSDVTAPGVPALHWGVAVRDHQPQHFAEAHVALFAARHDHGLDLGDEDVIRQALTSAGVDVQELAEIVHTDAVTSTLAREHTEAVERWSVFGVPTFIRNDVATFIRFMNRGAVEDLDRALEMLDWHEMNEFKRTLVPR
ncbi:MAG: DsbA family protein [Acidimicrobiia bacterium]